MKHILYKAETRGFADFGWLKSHQTFSFGKYYNPERVQFGALRVLNDDVVVGGRGFGEHPHDNMEIISIPIEGDLEHKDSMGNSGVIKNGDIQTMSAGTGISHSEFNKNKDIPAKFLQIWIFPNKKNVQPRYDQVSLKVEDRHNKLQQIVSPNPYTEGVWIHQNAWFFMGNFDENSSIDYELKLQGNGVFTFILNGEGIVNDQLVKTRDGIGIWDTDAISIQTKTKLEILIIEVPMNNFTA